MVAVTVKEASVKVSLGLILLIVGILGVARGGVDAPRPDFRQLVGTGVGVASFMTLAAAFLLVGGLLILARTGSVSFEASRGHLGRDAGSAGPGLGTTIDQARPEKT
jgi:hypothetical protein